VIGACNTRSCGENNARACRRDSSKMSADQAPTSSNLNSNAAQAHSYRTFNKEHQPRQKAPHTVHLTDNSRSSRPHKSAVTSIHLAAPLAQQPALHNCSDATKHTHDAAAASAAAWPPGPGPFSAAASSSGARPSASERIRVCKVQGGTQGPVRVRALPA